MSQFSTNVDDILVMDLGPTMLDWLLQVHHKSVALKNLGEVSFFMDLQLTIGALHCCQDKHTCSMK